MTGVQTCALPIYLDLIAEIITELDKKTDIDAILRQLSGKSVN